jgi:hypothetical protein
MGELVLYLRIVYVFGGESEKAKRLRILSGIQNTHKISVCTIIEVKFDFQIYGNL